MSSLIADLEERHRRLGLAIEAAIKQDRILLGKVDGVEAHCRRFQDAIGRTNRAKIGEIHTSPGLPSCGSSTTDTTGADDDIRSDDSNSDKQLPQRENCQNVSSLDTKESKSAMTSSPLPRSNANRQFALAKETEVRSIMSGMQQRMKRRGSA